MESIVLHKLHKSEMDMVNLVPFLNETVCISHGPCSHWENVCGQIENLYKKRKYPKSTSFSSPLQSGESLWNHPEIPSNERPTKPLC